MKIISINHTSWRASWKKLDFEKLREIREIVNLVEIHYIRQRSLGAWGTRFTAPANLLGTSRLRFCSGMILWFREALFAAADGHARRVRRVDPGGAAVPASEVSRYGIVGPGIDPFIKTEHAQSLLRVADLVEKPPQEEAPSNIAILGRYIIEPEIFGFLEQQTPGAGGEIQLTDALRELMEISPMYAYSFEGKRYDIGTKMGYLKATVEMALEREDLREGFEAYLRRLLKV